MPGSAGRLAAPDRLRAARRKRDSFARVSRPCGAARRDRSTGARVAARMRHAARCKEASRYAASAPAAKELRRKGLYALRRLLRSIYEGGGRARAGAPPVGGRWTDGGERGARNDRQRTPRARGHAAGPPPFINRRGLVALPAGRVRPRVDPASRAFALSAVRSISRRRRSRDLGGGRPFAPRVSIDRAFLPGTVKLTLGCDFEARLARATQVSFSLTTPKRHGLRLNVGAGSPALHLHCCIRAAMSSSQRGDWMTTPAIKSLDTFRWKRLSLTLMHRKETSWARRSRSPRTATSSPVRRKRPDDAEVHHALFLSGRRAGSTRRASI